MCITVPIRVDPLDVDDRAAGLLAVRGGRGAARRLEAGPIIGGAVVAPPFARRPVRGITGAVGRVVLARAARREQGGEGPGERR